MLPLPNLDDQKFHEIVEAAKKQLQKQYPQWSDLSPHDPGITFIELFAWLKEMQQNYLNQIGAENTIQFLKLMGVSLKRAKPAETEIQIRGIDRNLWLPRGTKLRRDSFIYETKQRENLIENQIVSYILRNDRKQIQIPYVVENGERQFLVFGDQPKVGNEFFIGFRSPLTEIIELKINMLEEYPVRRNPIRSEQEFYPLSTVQWEYYGQENGVEKWYPLEVLKDTTYSFLYSGNIRFSIKGEHLPSKGTEYLEEGLYFLRCILIENGYDVVPKVRSILMNTAFVEQRDTKSETFTFTYGEVFQDQLIIDSYLAFFEDHALYVKQKGKWIEVTHQRNIYHLEKNLRTKQCTLHIFNPETLFMGISDEKEPVIQLSAYTSEMSSHRIVGRGNRFDFQEIKLPYQKILYDDFELLVGNLSSENKMEWEHWCKIEEIRRAKPNEHCYQLKEEEGILCFGDQEHGAVPYCSTDNICILSCTILEGEDGNIQVGEMDGLDKEIDEYAQLEIIQTKDAHGGTQKETVSEGKLRLRQKMRTVDRAVTIEDYEEIVRKTPGLMIDHVKALPLFRPGLKGYPKEKEENCVTLVVEPYRQASFHTQCLEVYKKNIQRYIERFRLITTEIFVVGPEYIGIEVYGEIVVKPYYDDAEQIVHTTLKEFIQDRSYVNLGEPLFYGDVYGTLDLLECVSYIRHLSLEPIGHYIEKTGTGDIRIPPNGRIYLRQNQLTIITSEIY